MSDEKKNWAKPNVESFQEDELMKKMAAKTQTGHPDGHGDGPHNDTHGDSPHTDS